MFLFIYNKNYPIDKPDLPKYALNRHFSPLTSKSTMKAEFNVIKKDDKVATLVKISKYKKDEWDKPEWEDTFWFGNSSLYYKKDEKTEEDKKVFGFFEALEGSMRSCAYRTNLTRDRYLADYLNGGSNSSSSSSDDSDDDDDDSEFPF